MSAEVVLPLRGYRALLSTITEEPEIHTPMRLPTFGPSGCYDYLIITGVAGQLLGGLTTMMEGLTADRHDLRNLV